MLLRTGRTSVGSTVGHGLTIEVTDWSLELGVPDTGPADATATARVELGSLAVREGTGGARPLSDKDRGEIENNARRTLDVGRHPTATFESTRIGAATAVTQSSYGIKPYSALLGALKVRDDVAVEIEVDLEG